MLSNIDFTIFSFVNQIASKNAILDFVGIFLANYFIWLLFFVVIFFGFLPPKRRGETISKANALRSIFGALLGGSLTLIIGQFIVRARPFVVHEVNLLIFPPITIASFPSFHTTLAFALACTLFLFNRKIGIWFFVAAMLIGIARVYVGVHYPSDIIFGAIIGCSSSLIIKFFIANTKFGCAHL
jgi:undecaprenyl-diphosphatase